jgi:Ca2+-binding RTX toxin-like protein
MNDFASIIGGNGDTIPVGSVDPSDEVFIFWRSGDEEFDLGLGDDVFFGVPSGGDLTVAGGTGDDTVTTGRGDDSIMGMRGDDLIDARNGDNRVAGGEGNDTIMAAAGEDTLHGGAGDDVIWAGRADDRVVGDSGDDVLYGEIGDDTLLGGEGEDTLFGGLGDDVVNGGEGDDVLSGGFGNDVFFFDVNFGNDQIVDLGAGDQIWIKAQGGVSDLGDLAGLISGGVDPVTTQPFTLITIGSDSIRIDNVDSAAFEANLATWVKIIP